MAPIPLVPTLPEAVRATGVPPLPGAVPVKHPVRRRRPLPDAQAIAEVALPDHAPPYDDAQAARRRSSRPRRLALVDAGPPDALPVSPARGDAEAIPGAGAWPSRFAQVLAETLAGARSAEQLAPWTTQQARRRISQLGPMLAAGPQPRIRRIIVTSPVAAVLEMTAVIAVGADVHAVAVRLERPRHGADPTSPADQDGPADSSASTRPDSAGPDNRPPGPLDLSGPPTALTAAPASIRATHLRATAHWLCTAVEVA